MMNNGSGVYVLCSDTHADILTEHRCFVAFGTFHGDPGVVESSVLKDARLFLSFDKAMSFRKNGLPKWARRGFKPMEVGLNQLLLARPMEYAEALGQAFQMELTRQMKV